MEDKITKAQNELLIKKIDSIAKTMDIKFQQWEDDRRVIDDINTRLKTVEAKVEGARDDIAVANKKMINRVDEHLEPVPEMVQQSVKDSISEVKKKSWFKALGGD
jgi:hypothetical protein